MGAPPWRFAGCLFIIYYWCHRQQKVPQAGNFPSSERKKGFIVYFPPRPEHGSLILPYSHYWRGCFPILDLKALNAFIHIKNYVRNQPSQLFLPSFRRFSGSSGPQECLFKCSHLSSAAALTWDLLWACNIASLLPFPFGDSFITALWTCLSN